MIFIINWCRAHSSQNVLSGAYAWPSGWTRRDIHCFVQLVIRRCCDKLRRAKNKTRDRACMYTSRRAVINCRVNENALRPTYELSNQITYKYEWTSFFNLRSRCYWMVNFYFFPWSSGFCNFFIWSYSFWFLHIFENVFVLVGCWDNKQPIFLGCFCRIGTETCFSR